MIKRLSHIAPLQFGKMLGVLYGLISLIFIPFFILFALFAPQVAQGQANHAAFAGGFVFMAILLPIFYAVFGFIGGVIAAAIYNLVAGWIGGLEFTFVDVAPASTSPPTLPPNY